ncbi:MAG TPA: phosphopantetheine-binding protein [Ignavibacteriaceae bacterium]|nr:phosphopantetheine-binding protein [Ignavibacteriaceae bacterium]
MKTEDLVSKLKTIVKPYTQNEEALNNINEETNFINDLEINSANLIDVILDVEKEFNIEIDDDSIGKMITVKDTIEIINTKINQT